MVKRMLIDDTQPEETRVVIVNGNKIEDVEFESTSRKQIKGNIYLAKVMRIEPSLQAAFVDYGGNRHGFLAFGEIHPDYYNVSPEVVAEVEKEVDELIEAKKQYLKEKEAERERIREERARRREERLKEEALRQAAAEAAQANAETEASSENEAVSDEEKEKTTAGESMTTENQDTIEAESNMTEAGESDITEPADNIAEASENNIPATGETENASGENEEETPVSAEEEVSSEKNKGKKNGRRHYNKGKRRFHRKRTQASGDEVKVLAEAAASDEKISSDDVVDDDENEDTGNEIAESVSNAVEDDFSAEANNDADDDDEWENDFELQRKLLCLRKLYHRSVIQDVIKEGQILLVQVVKEERGNKGAALTTYLSLAGRYCVLMPNRIKSGGVSRKITNAADRKRLKGIIRELPLTADMSMIVRTAGEEKTKADIVRDYNYLIRTWNNIRIASLQNKAPALIHEEGNLIKRALRDMFSKDTSEVIVDGEQAYHTARDFMKMLAPQNLRRIRFNRKNELPLFQRFQVEAQLDKLHDTNVQLESGGYLVINPTEALVSIDVNSGKATKEKDLEETALKTNLEAADEIARQLRMRDLAGLIVVDFIDMEDPKNNQAVEKRMKEAMKDDRARVQIAKMSCFGLLEISRQRMHSSFFESNYKVCPFCHGKGLIRTIESSCVLILRSIEEEGIKNRSSQLNIFLPADVAIYILNQKRQVLSDLEKRYNMTIIISADSTMKCVEDFRIERIKAPRAPISQPVEARVSEYIEDKHQDAAREENGEEAPAEANEEKPAEDKEEGNNGSFRRNGKRERRGRFDRRERRRGKGSRDEGNAEEDNKKEKNEAVILYNSHEDIKPQPESSNDAKEEGKKETWWRKLIS